MYFKSGLKVLFCSFGSLMNIAKNISAKEGCSKISVYLDSVYCLFNYGTIFSEYQALDFFIRTNENRKTFVTALRLLEQLKKYNPINYRSIFHDKRSFNEKFYKYLNRDWMVVTNEYHTGMR